MSIVVDNRREKQSGQDYIGGDTEESSGEDCDTGQEGTGRDRVEDSVTGDSGVFGECLEESDTSSSGEPGKETIDIGRETENRSRY